MDKLILHIGRHKSGTTAIQRFLYSNPKLLSDHGISYPSSGLRSFGHHELATPLAKGALATSRQNPVSITNKLREQLIDKMSPSSPVTVISSEAFQNCDPKNIRLVFPQPEVEVVVYIREQTSYLLSAYAQKVQATNYHGTLEELFKATSKTTYKEFLDAWSKAFDGKLRVKTYDRNELVSKNVVVDFCQSFLGISPEIVKEAYHKVDANPSLSGELVDFKVLVNRHQSLSDDNSRALFTALSKLAQTDTSGSVEITDELAQKVADRYRKSNAYVAKKYFQRKALFQPYQQSSDKQIQPASKNRLRQIRDLVIEKEPTLADCLKSLPL